MKNFDEMIQMAKEAKTAEDLLSLAKENGVELTAQEAKLRFDQLHPASGELSDDELDNVSGGGCGSNDYSLSSGDRVSVRPDKSGYSCKKCGGKTGILEIESVSGGITHLNIRCDKAGCDGYIADEGFADPTLWFYKI